ncbi:hypothetical protein AB0L70_26575 [Kribbella sp. NPDC051952]|uniref:hypothetical protein n=1 Tax=Kribbella sp. NPDC051952 TaxID=3154851 RepID=UPI0034406726
MRNYWSLLPAIAVIVVLILVYAIPTWINPQWTSTILALFRQHPEEQQATPATGAAASTAAGAGGGTGGGAAAGAAEPSEAQRAAGVLGPQQVKSRRMLAIAMVVGALALIGFNVSLNREANGCWIASTAWGALPHSQDSDDPCVDMIYGSFFGDGGGESFSDKQQPLEHYQLVKKKKPKYLKWIQNSPGYDADILVGTGLSCNFDLKVNEKDDEIKIYVDSDAPCPQESNTSLTAVKLKKPIGDRKIVTLDDKPMTEIHPDADSWPTVVKKLVTGG